MGHQSTLDCDPTSPELPWESAAPEKALIGNTETRSSTAKTELTIASLFTFLYTFSYTFYGSSIE
jgi:hypothetical protein